MPWQIDPTPGARAARRRSLVSRPGQSDYQQMQLLELAELIRRNPWVNHRFGPEVQINIGTDSDDGSLVFRVARAP